MGIRGWRVVLVSVVAAFGAAAASAHGYTPPGSNEIVSVRSDGTAFGGQIAYVVLSGDGTHAAFHTSTSTVVPGDANNLRDVFSKNLRTGVVEIASRGQDGVQIKGESLAPGLSPDGRFTVFTTGAAVVPEDDNNGSDVYVYDRAAKRVELISVAPDGTSASGGSSSFDASANISDDGRFVVFSNTGGDLVAGVPTLTGANRIYVRDRVERRTELISVAQDGTAPTEETSQTPSISANGAVVAFESDALLTPDAVPGVMNAYARDRRSGRTVLVSRSFPDGAPAGGVRARPSPDGRFITFDSSAGNITPRDSSATSPDVFVHDLDTGRTERVSVDSAGAELGCESYRGVLSQDGRITAFHSCTRSGTTDTTSITRAWLHDRRLGTTELVSLTPDGTPSDKTSQSTSISHDGRRVAFVSLSTLHPTDTDAIYDAFVRDRGPEVGVAGPVAVTREGAALRVAGSARLDGGVLASGQDPTGDVAPGDAVDATGDISGARLTFRPEDDAQLLGVIDLARYPDLGADFPGSPGAVWGIRFRVDGVPYEVRAMGGDPVDDPDFRLFSCATACVLQPDPIAGSHGTAAPDVRFAIPLGRVGGKAGSKITQVRAFAGVGADVGGAAQEVDAMALPDSVIPEGTVTVTAGGAAVTLVPQRGRFDTTVPTPSTDVRSVAVKVCAGARCVQSSAPIPEPPGGWPNRAPAGFAIQGPDAADPGEALAWEAVTDDPDGDSVTMTWDFGDGATGSGSSVGHAYAEPGAYILRATADDGKGGRTVAVKAVTVRAPRPADPPAEDPDDPAEDPGTPTDATTPDAQETAGDDTAPPPPSFSGIPRPVLAPPPAPARPARFSSAQIRRACRVMGRRASSRARCRRALGRYARREVSSPRRACRSFRGTGYRRCIRAARILLASPRVAETT